MKKQNYFLTLLLVLVVWPGDSTAQAQSPLTVAVWGPGWSGETIVPVAARSGVTAIAAGPSHIVALKNDGTVVAWGDNRFGQVTGTPTTNLPYPATASPVTLGDTILSGVTAIAAGTSFTVALKDDGSVVAWGFNGSGETTIPEAAQTGVTAIAAGSDHIVGLKSNGSVVAWGANWAGQSKVPVTAQIGVKAIAAGRDHSVALKTDGSVVAWGRNDFGQITGIPTANAPNSAIASPVMLGGQVVGGVTAIAAGTFHTAALKSDGSVVSWGANWDGQTTVPVAAHSGVTAIAAGGDHTVALKKDGTVVAWGDPPGVPADLLGVVAVAAGGDNTAVLLAPDAPIITMQPVNQSVNEWQNVSFSVAAKGYPLYYQWRRDGVDIAGATSDTYRLDVLHTNQSGHSYSVVVSNLAGSVTSVPPAVVTVNAVPATGLVAAWGESSSGQTDVPVAAQSGVTSIAAGGGHAVALKNDGAVVAWGDNSAGQVTGIPTSSDFESPHPYFATASRVTLGGEVLSGVTAIAAAGGHTVALKSDGSVVAWGANESGQVTGITRTDYPYSAIANPVTLNGQALSGVVAIATSVAHTVALRTDGTLAAWGDNRNGQVTGTPRPGNSGDPSPAIVGPVRLSGQVLNGVTAIAAGGWCPWGCSGFTVALKNDGTVVAWGDNQEGQVTGTPTTDEPYFAIANPVRLNGQVLSGVRAIAAGGSGTLALKNDGTVVAWGDHNEVESPLMLDGQVLSSVMAIAAGGFHTVALKNDGTVVAWGYNSDGQVTGSPITSDSSVIANPVTPGDQVLVGVTAIAAGNRYTVALIGTAPLLPSLRLRPDGNEFIVSWPTNAVGFTLQSTTNLVPPVSWIDYGNPAGAHGAQFKVTNSVSGTARFYRLIKQ